MGSKFYPYSSIINKVSESCILNVSPGSLVGPLNCVYTCHMSSKKEDFDPRRGKSGRKIRGHTFTSLACQLMFCPFLCQKKWIEGRYGQLKFRLTFTCWIIGCAWSSSRRITFAFVLPFFLPWDAVFIQFFFSFAIKRLFSIDLSTESFRKKGFLWKTTARGVIVVLLRERRYVILNLSLNIRRSCRAGTHLRRRRHWALSRREVAGGQRGRLWASPWREEGCE